MRGRISNKKTTKTKEQGNVSATIGNMAALQYDLPKIHIQSGNNAAIQCVRILDAENLAANIKKDTGKDRPCRSQAHHIIPNELVVEGLDAVGRELIGGSFTGVTRFFDGSWNGVFLGVSNSIDSLPMHDSNHPEYTYAVRKYIGGRISELVTRPDYAQEIARTFRAQLEKYYKGEVHNISSISGFTSKGVNQYYQDIAWGYLNNIHDKLKCYKGDYLGFEQAIVGSGRFARGRIHAEFLYDLGFALEHERLADADRMLDLSAFRNFIDQAAGQTSQS